MTDARRSPSDLRQLAEELVADDSVQGELPVADVPIDPESADWLYALISALSALGVFAILLIIVAVVLVALLVLWIRGLILDRRAKVRTTVASKSSVTVSGKPLADARTLADEGEYANAIHLLLLQTISELRSQTEFEDRESWTSREVLDRSALTDEARQVFERLIVAVEEFYFGTRVAGADDFEKCAEWFEMFRRAARGE